MKVTWLGQASLLFETEKATILIDPYFSDSVEKINPKNYRRVPTDEAVFDIGPDIIIFTHNHLDHYDPQTAVRFITASTKRTVLAPQSVWDEVRKTGGDNNYVMFNKGTSWSEKGVRFTAVKAEHSDAYAIGVIIDDGENKYYITGDTLYNENIFPDIPDDIFAVFLPVNGAGNNMNMEDAKRFCERIRPCCAVPIHCGMFDELDMNNFKYTNKIVPEIYKEVCFE